MTVSPEPQEPPAAADSSSQSARLVSVPGASVEGAEFTTRALVGGCLIGSLLAISNVYMGLKTGWWESGSIMAAMLGFSGLSALSRRSGGAPAVLETNLVQTVASSVGAMPAAAGLLGSLPALALMGVAVPAWSVVVWGVSLGVIGVLATHLLRRRLLVEEALAFPTGVATAEIVTTMHKAGRVQQPGRARALVGAGLGSMVLTWLRDVAAWVPALVESPGRLAGLPASTFTWGFGWNPMMLGIGIIVGLPMGLSLLLGAVLAWGLIAPALAERGVIAASGGYEAFAGWLIWPGVGLMVGSAIISLAVQARSLLRAVRDLRALGGVGEGVRRWVIGVGLAACGLVLVLGYQVFELSLLHMLLVLALVLPLCAVCGRGAGQMDVAPVGQMGQIAQAASGTLFSGTPALNVAAGSVVAGAVAQTGVSLWSLKAGHLLGASPSRQLHAQLLGVLVGAAVGVPAYLLLVNAYGLGSKALPVPTAHQFRAVAELATRGLSGLPPYAAWAAVIGFGVGAALTLASRGRLERFVPSAVAVGLGFILPAFYAVTIATGALLAALLRRARPQELGQHLPALGAGTIAGESLMGLTIAGLRALGVIPG
jgi:uncharacterized oligopeptide transporter (OPT) family protein